MSIVLNYFDLNSAAGKDKCLLCNQNKYEQRYNRITSVMREHLKTKTTNCFCVFGHILFVIQII